VKGLEFVAVQPSAYHDMDEVQEDTVDGEGEQEGVVLIRGVFHW
jgi:hypothetical protein